MCSRTCWSPAVLLPASLSLHKPILYPGTIITTGKKLSINWNKIPIAINIAKTTDKKQQCYPLCFFSWRPIKNESVTPYVFFMTTKEKQQCYPLCFFSWRPIKKQQCYPLCFFSWWLMKNNSFTPHGFFHDDQRKTTMLSLMFHLIKTTVLPFMFFFMTTNKKQQCYPLCFFSWRPIKKQQC